MSCAGLRAAATLTLAGLLCAPGAYAQSADSRPEFEAASIRLNVDGTPYVFNGMRSLGTFVSDNQSLRNLIQEAFGVPSGRRSWLPAFVAPGQGMPILGGRDAILSERYDITAKWNAAPAGGHITTEAMEKAQSDMEAMLRTLLEQRFQLKLHRETRELPVYELTVSKPGKLRRGSCVVFDPEQAPTPPGQPAPDYCGASRVGRKGLDWTLDGRGMKISDLANTLSYLIGDRTVVDKTGYSGTFDAHLRWTPGQGETGATWATPSADDVNESVFTVIDDQLGLKLKAGKGPVEVIVIDRVERPSAN